MKLDIKIQKEVNVPVLTDSLDKNLRVNWIKDDDGIVEVASLEKLIEAFYFKRNLEKFMFGE